MADRNEIRRRLLWRLFGTPLTLVPMFGGASMLLSPIFFGVDPAIPIFLGFSTWVVGAGIFAMRGILGRETISKRIVDELEQEAMAARQAQLNALRRRLVDDGDSRTEQLLDDLLALIESVREDSGWRANVNSVIAVDLLNGVDNLFEGCLLTLERTLELAKTIAKVTTPAAKKGLVTQREQAVQEVVASVEELGRYLSELRVLGTESAPEQELNRIRKDIDASLAAARQTATETASWSDKDAEFERRRKRAQKESQ